jgi:hypothetical protein
MSLSMLHYSVVSHEETTEKNLLIFQKLTNILAIFYKPFYVSTHIKQNLIMQLQFLNFSYYKGIVNSFA